MTTVPITSTGLTVPAAPAVKPHAARTPDAATDAFSALLDAAGQAPASDRTAASAVPSAGPITPLVAHESRVASPLEQFEGFVLRSFIESMLPSEASSYFGSGTAGEVWRSMMAEEIGNELARGGGIGIAAAIAADRSNGSLEGESGENELNRMLRDSDVARAGAARHDTTR